MGYYEEIKGAIESGDDPSGEELGRLVGELFELITLRDSTRSLSIILTTAYNTVKSGERTLDYWSSAFASIAKACQAPLKGLRVDLDLAFQKEDMSGKETVSAVIDYIDAAKEHYEDGVDGAIEALRHALYCSIYAMPDLT